MSASLSFTDFDISVIWGKYQSFKITIIVRDANGDIVTDTNLDNWKFWFTAKTHKSDADDDAILLFNTEDNPTQLVIEDSEARLLRLSLFPSDLVDPASKYALYCEIQGILDTNQPICMARGKMTARDAIIVDDN